ncbi:DNA primase [Candidatus Gracilibacteria bacterium]|nr:DNA primase [Candidatus Gracilibacteria bacterium]
MSDRFLEDLKNRIDLVELVRKYAELKKAGKNFMCRSPFRNERTASFCVSPDKQFWYDFGNSEGGDAISFIERIENLNFQESVEMLAEMAGLEIPASFGEKKGPSLAEKKDIFSLHDKAVEFFTKQLEASKEAKEYLKKRQISDEVIGVWKLGYGGDSKDGLNKFLLEQGFAEKDITSSGVAFVREFGAKKMGDRFWGRLMIPISDSKDGRIIAFTGRDLSGKKDIAKYVNSPENPVYHKSATLFGLDKARKAIREKDAVILVEGNFDVISTHTSGFTHTVATCGTSLTDEHLRILKRLTKNIYLAFDSDIAGKKATLKAVEMVLKMEMNPFIIDIPEGKDLDDLSRKDPEGVKKAVGNAQNAILFLFERFAAKYFDETIEGEKKFLDAVFYFLQFVHRPIERDEVLSRLTKKTKRAKAVIEEEFRKFVARQKKHDKPRIDETRRRVFTREECFVGFLSANWEFFKEKVSEKTLDILSGFPKDILEKRLIGEELKEEEQKILLSWEMHEENLYGENVSEDVLERDAKVFASILQKEKDKKERTESAKKMRDGLKIN